MLSSLPRLLLREIDPAVDLLVLCATPQIAQDLREAHARQRHAAGESRWAALAVATPAQWLDHLVSAALLRDEVPLQSLPGVALTRSQELALWQRAITEDPELAGEGVDALFDRQSLARSAREADALKRRWKIDVPATLATEEYRAFRRWQQAFDTNCANGKWVSESALLQWRLDCLARGVTGLPAQVALAGFTAVDPFIRRLVDVLTQREVRVCLLETAEHAAAAEVLACADPAAECHAAAAWVLERLTAQPSARLRIVVSDLTARRAMLEMSLDRILHPDHLGCDAVQLERDFSVPGGTPLAEQYLVDMALRLLQVAVHPRQVAQTDFGVLLRGRGWSADKTEADGRALFERALRERLPPEVSLDRLLRQLRLCREGNAVPQLAANLEALRQHAEAFSKRQLPGRWAMLFRQCLGDCGWPGQAELDRQERLARRDFLQVLENLARLDDLLGRISAADALSLLQRECRDARVMLPRNAAPRVDVVGLYDAMACAVDGLWVMGANEELWPVPANANGLLPAAAQRLAGVSVASPSLRLAQAQEQKRRLLQAAPDVVFSWARQAGSRELSRSPLIASLPQREFQPVEPACGNLPLEFIPDAKAPAVGPDEVLRGGTWLIQAQSICPAWSFYQYRLGATVLPAPTFGLDARGRGLSLHAALEVFWRGRSHALVAGMNVEERQAAITSAVLMALDALEAQAAEPMAPRFRQLEGERLVRLLGRWVDVELKRPAFEVHACEERHAIDIEGLPVRVVIDRIDRLPDGRWIILDYKSSAGAAADSWSGDRISEPQLPIYAALVFPDQAVAAVALARVTLDGAGFVGIADNADLLPGVKGLEAARKQYPAEMFPDWPAVRRHWAESVRTLAAEILDGIAAVVVADEVRLAYCDVLPLLRLAERRTQWESSKEAAR